MDFIKSTMASMGLTPHILAEKMQAELNKIIVFNFKKHKDVHKLATCFVLMTKNHLETEPPCLELYGIGSENKDFFIIESLDFKEDIIKGLMSDSQYSTLLNLAELSGFVLDDKMIDFYLAINANLLELEKQYSRDVGVVVMHKPSRAKISLSFLDPKIEPFKEINLVDLIPNDEM